MKTPTVSFVVPCYNLAHLLRECIESILSQTFGDLEVLIMDDCSPDNTAEVAASFSDVRVQHIRNEKNLGHLGNYNKGITMSRGRYVWMLSADDYLRRNYVLERYVDLMEKNARVGYTFCPGVAVGERGITDVAEWVALGQIAHGNKDRIITGRELVKKLIRGNTTVCSSVLVRRECYERLGLFPLNMPWAGDWYLWCLFALYYDVGYFAEPMVCYREHENSMTNKLWSEDVTSCCEEDIMIPWEIKRKADSLGDDEVSRSCLDGIVDMYTKSAVSNRYRMNTPSMRVGEVKDSVAKNASTEGEADFVIARVLAGMGSERYWSGDLANAAEFYRRAIESDPWMPDVYAKRFLLSMGGVGNRIWRWLRRSRGSNVTTARA
ncbi:glycosyltransferase family 2 protein [Verrucomicrobiota bacterium sgz303538]